MVTRSTEDPKTPLHRFRLTDAEGQPAVFSEMAEAERMRAQHLSTFPSDQAEVVPADQADHGQP